MYYGLLELEIDCMIQFLYGGLRTSVTSERVNAINRDNTNIIYNAAYNDYIASHIQLL